MLMLGMKGSMSQRSWLQNLAQGGASAASGTLGNDPIFHPARFSGRKSLSPAKAGSGIECGLDPRVPLRSTRGYTLPPASPAR